MEKDQCKGFPPIDSEYSRVLILGSMPSIRSIAQHQYYGHPANQFWPLIYAIFQEAYEPDYVKRCQFLRSKKIALWDVLSSCIRPGSLDSSIRNAACNNFGHYLAEHPFIQQIYFNGQTARKYFIKTHPDLSKDYNLQTLPSTSPAYTIAFEKKCKQWKSIARALSSANHK